MVRTSCCDHKERVKKGAWTKEEDERLISYVRRHGEGSWRTLPRAAGLARCGKSCRLRWINYLRPNLKRGNFSKEEEELIINLQGYFGNKWSIMASRMPGRSDNEIKNYWNTHIKKRIKERERGTHPQPQPEKYFMKVPTIPHVQSAQHFSRESEDTSFNPLVNKMFNIGTTARHAAVNSLVNNTWKVGKAVRGTNVNPMVNNIRKVGNNAHALSSSDYSSSNTTTILFSGQESTKPAEMNLELSLSLPQSNDAVKISEKFKLEKKWEVYYPRLFGKSLMMPSVRLGAKDPVCLCYNLGGFLNGNRCNKCGCGIDDGMLPLFTPLSL